MFLFQSPQHLSTDRQKLRFSSTKNVILYEKAQKIRKIMHFWNKNQKNLRILILTSHRDMGLEGGEVADGEGDGYGGGVGGAP